MSLIDIPIAYALDYSTQPIIPRDRRSIWPHQPPPVINRTKRKAKDEKKRKEKAA